MIKFLSNNFIFKFLSFFIKPLISADVRYEGKEEFNQNYRIIYALSSESLIDLIVLNKVCKKQNITSPFDSLPNSKLKQFVSLKTPKYIVSEQKFQRQKTFNLEEILEVEKDIVIIPVSISWGKRPDKQQSLFRIIFSPSWRPAGSIKKIFKLLVHGRNIQIQFEKGLHVTDEIDLEKTNDQNSLILSRYLRAVFRKSKQAMLGPDISHRRTLVQSLVRNSHVRDEIKKLSDGKVSRQRQLSKKAYKYANEICSDLNYPIVSLLVTGFTWFWNTRYDGLHTKNIDKIREISKENSLIFVPCHRSHIDYCALSYLLHENGLMLPQVAAGNNLNLPIIGGILRGGGGVFMRRSFMNNSLYSVVFFEYIRALMTRGSSIEFFPEGGRSRTGLSLPARPGLLSLTLRSFASLKMKQVKVIPVYIGYEKILEGQSYLSELSGGKKKTESIFDPFKVFKDFRNYLGNAYLNFSEPIDLETFLKENVGEDYEIQSPQEKPEWLDKVTIELGESVTRSINNSVAVTSSSLFAVALLTEPTQTLSKEDLTKRINFFLGLIEDTPDYKDVWLTQKDTEEIILKTEKLGFIQSKMIGSKKIYRPTSDQVATLSFYKNNIAHIFVLYSLICESVKFVNRAPKDKVIKLIQMIYPIFSKDFHLKNKMVDDIFIEQAIDVLIRKGLLELEDEVINAPSEHSRYREEYIALSNLCEPSLKRFYIAMSVIWNKEMILKEDFRKECKDIAKKLEALEGWPYPEFSDSAKFDNFLYMMIRTKFFKEDEMNLLSASKITKKAKIGYEQFFDKEFIGFIDKQLI